MTNPKQNIIIRIVSERSRDMYLIEIGNDKFTSNASVTSDSMKGVMLAIQVFEKRYGKPNFINVLLLSDEERSGQASEN